MAVTPIIPPDWAWVYTLVVGQNWPQADEDKLRNCAQAWTDALGGLVEISGAGGQAGQNVHYSVQAVSSDQFDEYWKQYTTGDDSAVGQLAQQCQMLAEELLQFAEQTEFTKISIDIQLIILLIQLFYDFVIAPLTGGLSMAEGLAAALGCRVVVGRLLMQLIESVAMAVLPDLITQLITLAEGHRSKIDVGELWQAAQMGAAGAVAGAAAGKLLGGLGKGLENRLGKQVGGLLTAGATGALTNVMTNSAVSMVNTMENPDSQGYAQDKSNENPLAAIANGAFTGMLFHGVREMSQKPTVHLTTSDGTTFRGVQTGDSSFTLFPENGDNHDRMYLGTLADDGTLQLSKPPFGDKSTVTPQTLEISHRDTTVHSTFTNGEPQVTQVDKVSNGSSDFAFSKDGQTWTAPKDSVVSYHPDQGAVQVVVPTQGKQPVYAGNGDGTFALVGHQEPNANGGYTYYAKDPEAYANDPTGYTKNPTGPVVSAADFHDAIQRAQQAPASITGSSPHLDTPTYSTAALADALGSPPAAPVNPEVPPTEVTPAKAPVVSAVQPDEAPPVAAVTPVSGSTTEARGSGDTTVKRSAPPWYERPPTKSAAARASRDRYATQPDPNATRDEQFGTQSDPYATQPDVFATQPDLAAAANDPDATKPDVTDLGLHLSEEATKPLQADWDAELKRRQAVSAENTDLFDGETGLPLGPAGERILARRVLSGEDTHLFDGETGLPLGPAGEKILAARGPAAPTEPDPTSYRLRGKDSGSPGVRSGQTEVDWFDSQTGRRRDGGGDEPTAPLEEDIPTDPMSGSGGADEPTVGDYATQQLVDQAATVVGPPTVDDAELAELQMAPTQPFSDEFLGLGAWGPPLPVNSQWPGAPPGVIAAREAEEGQLGWWDYQWQGRAFRDPDKPWAVPVLRYHDGTEVKEVYLDGRTGEGVLYDAKHRPAGSGVKMEQVRRQQAALDALSRQAGKDLRMRLEVSDPDAAELIAQHLDGLHPRDPRDAKRLVRLLARTGMSPAHATAVRERITGLSPDVPEEAATIRRMLRLYRMRPDNIDTVLREMRRFDPATPDGRMRLSAILDDQGVHRRSARRHLVDAFSGLDASRPHDRELLDKLLRGQGMKAQQRAEVIGRLRGMDRIEVVYQPPAKRMEIGVALDDPWVVDAVTKVMQRQGLTDATIDTILPRLRGLDLSIPDDQMRLRSLLDDYVGDPVVRHQLASQLGQLNRPGQYDPVTGGLAKVGGRPDQAHVFENLDPDELAQYLDRITVAPLQDGSPALVMRTDSNTVGHLAALYDWDAAVSYGSWHEGVTPALAYTTQAGKRKIVQFDALDGNVLVDRKFGGIEKDQAQRQYDALQQNGVRARWEFPDQASLDAAAKNLRNWGLAGGAIDLRVVPFDSAALHAKYEQWLRERGWFSPLGDQHPPASPDGSNHEHVPSHLHEIEAESTEDRKVFEVVPEGAAGVPVRLVLERTPTGWSLHSDGVAGKELHERARAIGPEEGILNVVAHATRDGFLIDGRVVPFREVFQHIELPENADLVRLISCEAGGGDALLELADRLGRPVIASDKSVWITKDGELLSASPVDPLRNPYPKRPPDGHWLMFTPRHDVVSLLPGDPRRPQAPPGWEPEAQPPGQPRRSAVMEILNPPLPSSTEHEFVRLGENTFLPQGAETLAAKAELTAVNEIMGALEHQDGINLAHSVVSHAFLSEVSEVGVIEDRAYRLGVNKQLVREQRSIFEEVAAKYRNAAMDYRIRAGKYEHTSRGGYPVAEQFNRGRHQLEAAYKKRATQLGWSESAGRKPGDYLAAHHPQDLKQVRASVLPDLRFSQTKIPGAGHSYVDILEAMHKWQYPPGKPAVFSDRELAAAVHDLLRHTDEKQRRAALERLAQRVDPSYPGIDQVSAKKLTKTDGGLFASQVVAIAELVYGLEPARHPEALFTNLMALQLAVDGKVTMADAIGYFNTMHAVGAAQLGDRSNLHLDASLDPPSGADTLTWATEVWEMSQAEASSAFKAGELAKMSGEFRRREREVLVRFGLDRGYFSDPVTAAQFFSGTPTAGDDHSSPMVSNLRAMFADVAQLYGWTVSTGGKGHA
jgi:hypothetical protein